MHLRELHLENFRSHDNLSLTFLQPRTLLVGENGIGKSSVPDAIALALTGQCRGVNAKGEGQTELIKSGADEAVIRLTLSDGTIITRTIHRTRGATTSLPIDMILGHLRARKPYVTSVIYGGTFFDMHHADAKDLLMQVLNVTVTVNDGRTEGPSIYTLPEIDQKYTHWFEERKSLKRSLAAVVIPDVTRRVDLETIDPQQIDADLATAKAEYEAAVAVTADVRAQGTVLASRKQDLERAPADLSVLRTRKETHEGLLAQQQEAAATARAALAKLEEQPAEPVSALQTQVNELKLFVQRVEGHAGPKGQTVAAECVLGKGIPCLTPAKEFTDAIGQTKKQLAAIEKRIKAGTKRAGELAAAHQSVKDADKHVTYHDGQVKALTMAIEQEQRRQTDLAAVIQEATDIEPELVAATESVDRASEKLAHLQNQARELGQYRHSLATRDAALERRGMLQTDVNEAEEWVKEFGPNGARATALQAALDDFHATINAALAPFRFQLAITVDPWEVRVKTDAAGGWLKFDNLSKGQRLWTGLAFQMALAAVSGLDFCVVDDVDGIVGRNLQVMTQLVMAVPIGQILIVKAQAADAPVPEMDGLQVLQLAGAAAASAAV